MTKREIQKEQRRYAILEAALDLFVRKGFHATKISDIAKEVNMSTGLLFHYFESKEALYEELVKLGLEGTKQAMKFSSDNPMEFFEQVVTSIFHVIANNPSSAKMFVLMEQTFHNESLPNSITKLVKQVNNIEESVDFIKKGQEMGQIRLGNPLALSIAFWCSIQGIAQEFAMNTTLPCPDAQWILDILRKKG